MLAMLASAASTSALACSSADLEVAVVDAGEGLAGLHGLVVADQHVGDIAGDLRRDRGAVGLDIGIVGRHLEATRVQYCQPKSAAPAEGSDSHAGEEQGTQPPLADRLRCVGDHRGHLGGRDGSSLRHFYAGRGLRGRK